MVHAPHDPYFLRLQQVLTEAGKARPCLVLDRSRMERNAMRLKSLIAPGMKLRLVEKSLPVPAILDDLMRHTGTRALMVFHEPQLRQVVQRFPDSDLLMGKPMPVFAARHFYQRLSGNVFNPARQLQWLVDTPARLAEYLDLARGLGTRLRVNIEIDVGLHRGGVGPAQLNAMIETLRASPDHLEFAGLMGYDAHVGKLPSWAESRETSFAKAVRAYEACQAVVREQFRDMAASMCWNGAGSPTVALHRERSPLNDISAGSLLLKPTDFDIDLLSEFEPAIFIATPVLKALDGTRIPGPNWLSKLLFNSRVARAKTYFIYGGGWLAETASPPRLIGNSWFGTSYNQAMLNGPAEHALQVDDYVFFRPHQSEGMLLQFGPLLVVENERLVDEWAPFTES
jgi:D-serine deaminase-like pyridoxal phosphate-dependent protein